MPVATYDQYCTMIDKALDGHYAYPAINVTSPTTANAAIHAFAECGSDGIIQVSSGGGEFNSGQGLKNMVVGSISIADHVHLVADHYDVAIALHTDHCQPGKVDSWLKPLLEVSESRVAKGEKPLFNSHMFDGSELPLDDNMKIAEELLARCAKVNMILEVEAGVVGGEEDGVDTSGTPAEKLYTTPEDMVEVARRLKDLGRYMFAATFGNVHGSYKPGVVKLKPTILRDGQAAVVKAFGEEAQQALVFHGGSGSSVEEIHETLNYGVMKMNVDTDTQYAYTRPVIDYMLKNYDLVLKIDGEVGSKKHYDPRAWMKQAETGMTARIKAACEALKSVDKSILK